MGVIIAIYLLAASFLAGIVYLIYWVLKKARYRKIGLIISSAIAAVFGLIILSILFEDQLFFKRDVSNLLKGHDIYLHDDFKIINNKSMWAIGDYYHTFTLYISENDKRNVSNVIRHSANFQSDTIPLPLSAQTPVNYNRKRITQNYETQSELVRELFESNGKGYAPTYQIIKINKSSSRLIFEEIEE